MSNTVWDLKPLDPSQPINYVELKTSKECKNDRERFNFDKKLQRFWAQSFLLGVPKLIVGFRDNYGILQKVEIMETEKVPVVVRKNNYNQTQNSRNHNHNPNQHSSQQQQQQQQQVWDGTTVINFTAALLEWLREKIGAQPNGMWRIKFKERGSEVELYKVDDNNTSGIFTDEFIEWKESTKQLDSLTISSAN